MHSADVVHQAHALAAGGATQIEIARELCVGQTTVSRWLRQGPARSIGSPMRHRAMSGCPHACTIVDQAPKGPYAYLLGQYLGDGSIVRTKRGVYRLFITCCAAYPGIIDECVGAINAVLPENAVGRRAKRGAVDVNCYSKHLPCLFPQHGPGRKHDRPIELATWQEAIVLDAHPDLFVRGLIHSDGSRFLNQVTNATGRPYAYVRYQFTNRSDDIRALFTAACDRLGIEWRVMNRYDIAVSRRASVSKLDTIVGPKT